MFVKIPLDKIQDNPFQTRTEYNDIPDLAASIMKMQLTRPETCGLVQVPPARLWDVDAKIPLVVDTMTTDEIAELLSNGAVVQLAAGHRRYRAFQYLTNVIGHGDAAFTRFPVELGVYSDQAMADLVWTENHDRADLSAIEEAESLQRDMQAFNWMQQEIATRRNMSRSAVANKLRLLNLPEDAKSAIRHGQLTERHGRVLLQAQSLTPEIYKELADKLLPFPVADEIAEKARQLKTDAQHTFEIFGQREPCALCGTMTKLCLDSVQTRVYLCTACMRVATGWEPPSAAEADAMLKRLINSHAKRIDFFPLDQEIGGKSPCSNECKMLGKDGRSWQCIDNECHTFKTETWRSILAHKLRNCMAARWPDSFAALKVDFDGYHGYEMDEQDDMDRYLAAHVCSPACSYFSMRYYPHEYCHYVKLTDMPFIAVCFSTNSHNACARRLTKSEQARAELAEYNAELAESERRKKQGVELLRRAQIALAEALKEGRSNVFEALSHQMGQKAKDPYLTIAHWMTNHEYYTFNPDQTSEWTEKNADRYRRGVTKQLGDWGLALPPSADELIERLEKIARFIEEHKHDMTPEQIAGNIDNAQKLADEIGEAFTQKILTEADYNRLYFSAVDLRNRLVKIDNSRLVNVVSQETLACSGPLSL